MAINYHPEIGTLLICDFNTGLTPPEMQKRRPVIVISPRLRDRDNLCTVVPLSTTTPKNIMPYHHKLCVEPVLPEPYNSPHHWVKGDMLYTVSFTRLSLPFKGKDAGGKRIYDIRVLEQDDMIKIHQCILNGLGLQGLTGFL